MQSTVTIIERDIPQQCYVMSSLLWPLANSNNGFLTVTSNNGGPPLWRYLASIDSIIRFILIFISGTKIFNRCKADCTTYGFMAGDCTINHIARRMPFSKKWSSSLSLSMFCLHTLYLTSPLINWLQYAVTSLLYTYIYTCTKVWKAPSPLRSHF